MEKCKLYRSGMWVLIFGWTAAPKINQILSYGISFLLNLQRFIEKLKFRKEPLEPLISSSVCHRQVRFTYLHWVNFSVTLIHGEKVLGKGSAAHHLWHSTGDFPTCINAAWTDTHLNTSPAARTLQDACRSSSQLGSAWAGRPPQLGCAWRAGRQKGPQGKPGKPSWQRRSQGRERN